jgi:phage terminase large subunit GpA-like protein
MPLRVSQSVFDNLILDKPPDTWQWIQDNVVLTEGQRLFGFAGVDFPYAKGICEASDDPRIRELVVVAAAQVGKSVLAQSWLTCRIATQPANAMFASSDEKLAKRTTKDKLWPMFRACHATRPLCPKHRKEESSGEVRLRTATIRVAWSGSPSTLGDWTARWGWAGEVDKWSTNSSDEADPLPLFFKRFSAVNDYQWFAESTPAYEETSRIWRLLIGGSNCRYQVPCPRCKGYQELTLGNGKPETGGIVWDKTADGDHDALLALKTARYRCGLCLQEWGDEYRMPAVRKGIWVPEGCTISPKGQIQGEPLRPWPRASFQISRLYSPRTTWGRLAREYVDCNGDPELLRDYWNSTLGLAWRQQRQRAQWEDVSARLTGTHDLGTCPIGSIFLTAGVDVQGGYFVYLISAWGQRATGWCVTLGTCATYGELRHVLDQVYPHADGGPGLPVELTLMDAQFNTDEVVEFCESTSRVGRLVLPYHGARAGQLQGQKYRKIFPTDADASGRLAKSRKSSEFFSVTGNTNWWQSWADKILYVRRPGEDSSYAFYSGSASDEDLWTQLLGEVLDEKENPPCWVEISGTRHDLRDVWRYSRVAAEVNLAGAWTRLVPRQLRRSPTGPVIATPRPAESPRVDAQEKDSWFRRGGSMRSPPRR